MFAEIPMSPMVLVLMLTLMGFAVGGMGMYWWKTRIMGRSP